MKELLEAYGWDSVESKNHLMESYKKDDNRLNHYITTGTMTIQGNDGVCHKFYKVYSDEQTESIILKYEKQN